MLLVPYFSYQKTNGGTKMNNQFEVIDQKEQPVISMRKTTNMASLQQELGHAFMAVTQYLAELGETPTGSVFAAVAKHIREIFTWDCSFLIPDDDRLIVFPGVPGIVLDADDIAVATWAFRHGAVAGYDTDTLHGSRLRFIPLQGSRDVIGIMGVRPAEPDGVITHEQDRILTAFATQAALALERVLSAKRAGR
jgi:two-component system sensor histidine kinase KdpD